MALRQCRGSSVTACLSPSWSRRTGSLSNLFLSLLPYLVPVATCSCPISECATSCATSCIMACRVCLPACPNDTSPPRSLRLPHFPASQSRARLHSSSLLSPKTHSIDGRRTNLPNAFSLSLLSRLCICPMLSTTDSREDGRADRGLTKWTILYVIWWPTS